MILLQSVEMLLQIHLLHEHQRAVHEAALQLAPVYSWPVIG